MCNKHDVSEHMKWPKDCHSLKNDIRTFAKETQLYVSKWPVDKVHIPLQLTIS